MDQLEDNVEEETSWSFYDRSHVTVTTSNVDDVPR